MSNAPLHMQGCFPIREAFLSALRALDASSFQTLKLKLRPPTESLTQILYDFIKIYSSQLAINTGLRCFSLIHTPSLSNNVIGEQMLNSQEGRKRRFCRRKHGTNQSSPEAALMVVADAMSGRDAPSPSTCLQGSRALLLPTFQVQWPTVDP